MTTCWKHDLIHLTMSLEFGTCSALDKGAIQRRKVQQKTTEKVMIGRPSAQKMMIWSWPKLEATRLEEPWHTYLLQWDARYTSNRVDAIKEGNHSDHQHEAQEHLPILTPWVKQEQWRRHIIEAMIFAGESMVMTLKPRDARHYAPKTTWSRSLTSSDEFTRRYCSHQCLARPQKQIAAYFLIFKRPMKFQFQRIKNEANWSFIQEVMAKTSKVVHSEIFWTARSAKVKRS